MTARTEARVGLLMAALWVVTGVACLPDLGGPVPQQEEPEVDSTVVEPDLRSDGSEDVPAGDMGDADTTVQPDTVPLDTGPPALTYVNFAGPFVESYCTKCHQSPPKYGATMSLQAYELVLAKLDLIMERAVVLKEMPPMPPLPTDEEREMLGTWIEEGAVYK